MKGYRLRVTGYRLQVTGCGLRVAGPTPLAFRGSVFGSGD